MKSFVSWIGKKAMGGVVGGVFFVTTVASVTYVINYPATSPGGEVEWGKFTLNFTKIFSQLAFSPAKVTVTPDVCTSGGACLSTAAQKTDLSWAPVLYNLANNSAWQNMNTQTIRDQWRTYHVIGCDNEWARAGWSAATIANCRTNSDADIDAVIGYSYQPAIIRAIGYVKSGGAPDAWLPKGCVSAPNLVLCVQGWSCGNYDVYHAEVPAYLYATCIGTP